MESPPAVLYGQPSTSTGALLSGQLKVRVTEERLSIEAFTMKLSLDVKFKKPFHAHCPDCAQQSTELKDWNFLQGPMILNRGKNCLQLTLPKMMTLTDVYYSGEHDFPFSFLVPGHLPATMNGMLSSIEYGLKASIVPKNGEPITFAREIDVKRAIAPSEFPRQSIRIFPPTNLTAHVELPSVIHPIGEFNVGFRLDGVIKTNTDNSSQQQWRLKRLTWHLDETQKVISPACPKHAAKAGAEGEEKKGIAHQEVRTLNQEELKSGWKCDYSRGADGSIEMEFSFSIRGDAQPICDVKAEDGTEVSHVLVVEMIVAEEIAPIKKPTHVTPTGAARVLRMHFNTVLTERAGMGISWDEEQPPLYENVPSSPPGYGKADEYEGAPILDHEEMDIIPQI